MVVLLFAVVAHRMLHFKPAQTAGLFAGSLTNTPALASALDYLKSYAPKSGLEQLLTEPVIAYSLTYPMGGVGMILAIYLLQRLWETNDAREELGRVTAQLGELSDEKIDLDRSHLDYRRIFVSNRKIAGQRLRDLNLPQQCGAAISNFCRTLTRCSSSATASACSPGAIAWTP